MPFNLLHSQIPLSPPSPFFFFHQLLHLLPQYLLPAFIFVFEEFLSEC